MSSGGKPKFNDEQAKEMRRQYEAGATFDDVALSYGISRPTAKKYILQAGGQPRGSGPLEGTTGRLKTPQSFEDLQVAILKILPKATFSKDRTGQIIINTGLKIATVEVLTTI